MLTLEALCGSDSNLEVETKIITTSGDRRSDGSTATAGDAGVKGMFTKEIEQALLDGEIDIAVHSCKDLPGQNPPALKIGATLPRADTADLFIGRRSFSELPPGSIIGTSSVRRRRQLIRLRPGLQVREIRGNVPSRLEKLGVSGDLAGIVLPARASTVSASI